MAPHPESPFRRGRVPRGVARRAAALLLAAVVIGGTPLVARALDVEIAPAAVSGDLDTSTIPQSEPRVADAAPSSTPPVPESGEPTDTDTETDVEIDAEVDVAADVETTLDAARGSDDANPSPEPESDDPAPAPDATVEFVPVPTDTQPVASFPPGPAGSEWEALRQCESNGNYSITNPSGKYRGAYQFDRPTWNSVAERHAPRLVDVDPAAASPADQDAMAFALYSERGAGPWPQCGRHLS